MLKLLNDKNKICIVATSKPTVFAVKILEHVNLNRYFSFICGSNIDGTRSKKKEVIQHVIERNKIKDLSHVIMVGDRKHDVYGAKEVGLQVVGALYGYGNYDELYKSGADYIVNNIKELNKKHGITIILITHYMDEAAEADRVVVMDKGKVIIEGIPRDVFSHVETMKKIGLDVPQVTEICYELRKAGINIDTKILNVNEMVSALCQLK